MPWTRFWALYQQISALQAEDDLRALLVAGTGANPGEKGRGFRDYARSLEEVAGLQPREQQLSTLHAGSLPMVQTAQLSEIETFRERQRAAAERLEREHAAQHRATES